MVAVGIWSVLALPAEKVWQGPLAFMLMLALSAMAGMSGVSVPYLEHAISLSVVLFGGMLVLATKPVPASVGLGLIALASSLHGLAHGAETPETGFVGYAIGFLLTTAALHLSGVSLAHTVKRARVERGGLVWRGLGMAFGASGLYLFSQL